MAGDRVHSMRWKAEEWANIEHLAEHYGLAVPDLLRWLVSREVANVGGAPKRRASKLTPFRRDLLRVLARAEGPMAAWHVLDALLAKPFNYRPGDGAPGNRISSALEAMRREGLVTRQRDGYVVEDAGRAEIEG